MRTGALACSAALGALPVLSALGCVPLIDADGFAVVDGVVPAVCQSPEVRAKDGRCERAGVIACPEGFASDGAGGCEVALACARGIDSTDELPLPSKCFRFGCTPGFAATWVVNSKSAQGGLGAGTVGDPFATIGQAIAVAAPGEIVLVVDGQYTENIVIDKPIFLRGRCPTLGGGAVSIHAADAAKPVISVVAGTDPWEMAATISGLRIEGGSAGILVDGGKVDSLDSMWMEGTGGPGIDVVHSTDLVVSNSAIVGAHGNGIQIAALPEAMITIAGVLVRGTIADGSLGGHALHVLDVDGSICPTDATTVVTIDDSIFDQGEGAGILAEGVHLSVTDTLVVGSAGATGATPAVVARPDPARRHRGSLTAERLVVQAPRGGGIDALDLETARIANTVVRGVTPRSSDDCRGFGIRVESLPPQPARAQGWVCPAYPAVPPTALSISQTLVDGSTFAGLVLIEAEGSLDHVIVRNISREPCSGDFGDGITTYSQVDPGTHWTVTLSRIENVARAGVAAFGGAVSVGESELSCNAAGDLLSMQSTLSTTESACGCGAQRTVCVSGSSSLQPGFEGWGP